ncbi:MAG TPA: M28 family peptidase [Gemmatimonadaceae bacterium]|nr:M28 family peptidase [Gemmatimonadaceae bacterium]
MPTRTSAAHTFMIAALPVVLLAPLRATAQKPAPRSTSSAAGAPPGLAAIREADLRRDMEALASDAMRGREAGTLDELRASAWLAERARAVGLEPAGDDGTYFQFWPMSRAVTSPASRASYDGTRLDLDSEAVVTTPVDATIDAPVLTVATGATPDSSAARGKVLVTTLRAPSDLAGRTKRNDTFIYTLLGVFEEQRRLSKLEPAAIVVVCDSIADAGFEFPNTWWHRGEYGIDSTGAGSRAPSEGPPVILVRRAPGQRIASASRFTATLIADRFMQPSVNVIGRIRGTDPKLRDEYVLFSGHQDHDGVRFPINGDSIWNGADDNASTSVALLAIARAWKQHPGRRSALFVWHGAEERGLLGSRYHAAHPVVPITSIVGVLNGDMIGRNNPDTASLLGSQPPHRNSAALVRMAIDANARVSHFAIDSIWDRPAHPEGFYFRSDHVPYAARNVPSLFFTTVLHDIYHTPFDEPSRIEYPKLTRMAKWMYATGWAVSQTRERPAIDPGYKFPR